MTKNYYEKSKANHPDFWGASRLKSKYGLMTVVLLAIFCFPSTLRAQDVLIYHVSGNSMCEGTPGTRNISVGVQSKGGLTLLGTKYYAQADGGPIVTFTSSSNGIYQLFTMAPNHSASKYHTIKVYMDHVASDTNYKNDTAVFSLTDFSAPVSNFTTTPTCQGFSTNFTNTTTLASGSYTSSYALGDGNTRTGQSPSYTYGSYGTYNCILTVTTDKGCVNSTAKSVVINPRPTANFTTPGACLGSIVNFTNTSSIVSGSVAASWTFGDGGVSTAVSPGYQYASVGGYSVTLNSISDKGCTSSVTKTVNVNPNPSTSFSVSSACIGTATNFSNATTVSSGSFTSKWLYGDGNVSFTQSPSYTYLTDGDFIATLETTTDKGCFAKTTKVVTVNPKPVAQFTTNALCDGIVANFTNTSFIKKGSITTNSWAFGDATYSAAVSPTHTYTGPKTFTVILGLTSDKGCTASITKAIDVNPTPVPNFTTSATCKGYTTQFTNTTTLSTGSFTSKYMFGDGGQAAGNSPGYTYVNEGSFNCAMTVTSDKGCIASISKPVIVSPNPSASFTSAGACDGKVVNFNNTSSVSSGGSLSNMWDFGDGSGTSVAPSPGYKYAGVGIYTVNLTVTSDKGCIGKTSSKVSVNPNPVTNFSLKNVCDGVATSFTNLSTVASGSVNSKWYFGDGNVSWDQAPTHTYPSVQDYIVKLESTTDKGCTGTASKVITIYPNPVAKFTAKNVCDRIPVDFTNQSFIANGSITNTNWAFGDATYGTSNSPSHLYSAPKTFQVILSLVSNNGCKSSVTNPVTVYAKPVANFTTANVCDGFVAKFTNTSTISDDVINTIFWEFGDGVISYDRNSTHTYAMPGTYTVKAKATSNNGCTHDTSKSITIHPNPVADFTVADVCFGFPSNFINNSTGADSYIWDFEKNDYSTQTNPTRTYGNDGVFKVKLIANTIFGCTHNITKTATVYEKPVISVSDDASISKGHSIDLFAMSSIENSTFLWDNMAFLNDANSATPRATLDNTTTFVVVTTSPKGCKDTGSVTIKTIEDYKVYPNTAMTPNGDGINDKLTIGNIHNYPNNSLIIFDRWGREVYQKNSYNDDWDGKSASGSELPNGTYFYILTFDVNEDALYKGSITLIRNN